MGGGGGGRERERERGREREGFSEYLWESVWGFKDHFHGSFHAFDTTLN